MKEGTSKAVSVHDNLITPTMDDLDTKEASMEKTQEELAEFLNGFMAAMKTFEEAAAKHDDVSDMAENVKEDIDQANEKTDMAEQHKKDIDDVVDSIRQLIEDAGGDTADEDNKAAEAAAK
jgi:ABC-type transporter Mla subunit MlaD